MTRKYLICDIDATLLAYQSLIDDIIESYNYSQSEATVHLQKIIDAQSKYHGCFAIFVTAMSKIFKACLKQGVELGFITHKRHRAEDIIPLLRILYGLEANDLTDCIFIDKDALGGEMLAKGDKLKKAQRNRWIEKNAEVYLLDDEPLAHQASTEANGFIFVHATAMVSHDRFGKETAISSDYLLRLIQVLDLDFQLSANDLRIPGEVKVAPAMFFQYLQPRESAAEEKIDCNCFAAISRCTYLLFS